MAKKPAFNEAAKLWIQIFNQLGLIWSVENKGFEEISCAHQQLCSAHARAKLGRALLQVFADPLIWDNKFVHINVGQTAIFDFAIISMCCVCSLAHLMFRRAFGKQFLPTCIITFLDANLGMRLEDVVNFSVWIIEVDIKTA